MLCTNIFFPFEPGPSTKKAPFLLENVLSSIVLYICHHWVFSLDTKRRSSSGTIVVNSSLSSMDQALLLRPDGHSSHLSGGNPGPPYLYKEGLERPIKHINQKQ